MTVAPPSATITVGQTQGFSVTAKDANGNVVSGVSFTWTSDAPSVATVNASGSATAVSQGTAHIQATANSITGSATLTVTSPAVAPTITMEPANQTVNVGQTATFSVTATGTPPLAYQWQKNGANISGATGGSYTTPAVTAVDNGAQFRVVVSNQTGSVTSTIATLTVNLANAIPASFFGFTVNKACSVSDTDTNGANCGNPEHHSFPGLSFSWARSLGAGSIKWSDLVQCDPTGSVCPEPGSGCSKDGLGANGAACPASQLVANCKPSAWAPDDPTNCAYFWTRFDFWTKLYNSHGVDWMFDAYYTPDYLSVRGSRCTGSGQAMFGTDATCVDAVDLCGGTNTFKWGCDPPFDIDATPGSGLADGTDQHFKWFVAALMKHLQQNSEHIAYWEVWNEPNICKEWNHSDQTGVNCPVQNAGGNGGRSTGTADQLVGMARDARSIIPTYDPGVKIASPAVTGTGGVNNYMSKILMQGGQEFDVIGFHGYYAPQGGCPTNCPVPEAWVRLWNAVVNVTQTTGQAAKPVFDTEFSWSADSNVTDPDMRAAQSARVYLLHEGYYPVLARVDWYGEDFAVDLTPNPNNNNLPNGGTGEFWASGATNVQDNCVVADTTLGGFVCPAGLAMNQVAKWTVGATFDMPCSCSASPNGGNCAASTPTGIWQCSITRTNGHKGLFVWDNTATTFPCSNAACGSTSFTVSPGYTDWQDLNGNVTPLNGATVSIGAKPILIEK